MYIVRSILKVSAGWCSKSIDEPWWSWWTQALKLVAQRYFLSQAPPSDSKDRQRSAAWGYDIQTGSGQYGARLTGRCCLRASGPDGNWSSMVVPSPKVCSWWRIACRHHWNSCLPNRCSPKRTRSPGMPWHKVQRAKYRKSVPRAMYTDIDLRYFGIWLILGHSQYKRHARAKSHAYLLVRCCQKI